MLASVECCPLFVSFVLFVVIIKSCTTKGTKNTKMMFGLLLLCVFVVKY